MVEKVQIFVSSKILELRDERNALSDLLPSLVSGGIALQPWIYENDALAEDQTTQAVYLDALKKSSLYIGIFWNEYTQWTIDEFKHATDWKIERHIYRKEVDPEKRDPQLKTFLDQLVTVPTAGLAPKWFKSLEEFRKAVTESIEKWISSRLRRTAISESILASNPDHIPHHADKLVGREQLCKDIYALVSKKERVLLQGFSGTGKTSLAAEIATQYLQREAGKTVIWFTVGKRSASEVLTALAQTLGQGDGLLEKPEDEKIAKVRELLTSSNVGLIVLDDVQHDGKALRSVLDAAPRSLAVLITSLQRHSMVQNILEIPALTPDSAPGAALETLRFYSGRRWSDDNADANRLCQVMGYLPFALRIAGYKLRGTKTSLKDLLNQYERNPHNMRWDSAEDGRESVAVLLQSVLQDLESDVRQLFLAFGALSVPHTTAELFELYGKQLDADKAASSARVKEILGILVEHGLADTDPDSDIQVYSVHALAYTYAREQQSDSNRQAMVQACDAYARAHIGSYDDLSAELANLMGAAELAGKSGWNDLLIELARLLSDKSGYFKARGYGEGGSRLLEQAAEVAQAQGESGLEATLYLFSELGNYFTDYGSDVDKALAAYQRALAAATALENPNREAVLLSVIGSRLIRKKEMTTARWYLDAAQRLATAHHDDEALGKVYDYRGHYEVYAKNFEAAHAMFAKRQEMAERLKDDRSIFFSLNNLASAENILGRPLEAKAKYERAYEVGKLHGNLDWMAAAQEGLGETYQNLGQIEEARIHFQQALDLYRKTYAQEGIDIVTEALAELSKPNDSQQETGDEK